MKRTMHSLACGKFKILKKSPEGSTILDDHTFEYNPGFSDKIRKLRVPMASLDETHNAKKTDDERVHTTEAAIVRIMKARHSLGHQELTAAVMEQVRRPRARARRAARRARRRADPRRRPRPPLAAPSRSSIFFSQSRR